MNLLPLIAARTYLAQWRASPPLVEEPAQVPTAPAVPIGLEPLLDCRGRLETFVRDAESELLRIGTAIKKVYDGSDKIRADSERFRDSLAAMTRKAGEQLGGLSEDFRNANRSVTQNQESMAGIRQSLRGLIGSLGWLENRIREFRVMATMVRIEGITQAGGSADFSSISLQATEITSRFGSLLDSIHKSVSSMEVSFANAATRLANLSVDSSAMTASLQLQLEHAASGMLSEQESVNAAVAETALKLRQVRDAQSELIMALQIHDMMRQQVEHLCLALPELHHAPHLKPGESAAGLAIVRAQLHQAVALCEGVAQTAAEGLANVLPRMEALGELAESIAALADPDSPARQAFAQQVQGMLAVLPRLTECDAIMREAMAELCGGITCVEATVEQVSLAALRMKWLGLNATIEFSRIGQAGAAAEVVAKRTTETAAEVESECLRITTQLRALSHQASSGGPASVSIAPVGNLPQVLNQTKATLDSLHLEVRAQLQEEAILRKRLVEDVVIAQGEAECFRHALSVPQQVEAEMSATLEAMPPAAAPPFSETALGLFDSWAARYTMESERKVHYETLGIEMPAAETGGFEDDSIELF